MRFGARQLEVDTLPSWKQRKQLNQSHSIQKKHSHRIGYCVTFEYNGIRGKLHGHSNDGKDWGSLQILLSNSCINQTILMIPCRVLSLELRLSPRQLQVDPPPYLKKIKSKPFNTKKHSHKIGRVRRYLGVEWHWWQVMRTQQWWKRLRFLLEYFCQTVETIFKVTHNSLLVFIPGVEIRSKTAFLKGGKNSEQNQAIDIKAKG